MAYYQLSGSIILQDVNSNTMPWPATGVVPMPCSWGRL